MTRAEALRKISELKSDIETVWEEIEELCDEHKIVVSRPDEDAYRQYYAADKETLFQHIGYEVEADHIDFENRLPGWIASTEFEG